MLLGGLLGAYWTRPGGWFGYWHGHYAQAPWYPGWYGGYRGYYYPQQPYYYWDPPAQYYAPPYPGLYWGG
jgi:hypothetical protein